ncbi:MAG: hypothetical protein JWM62_2887 [Frankiales bacterium]|nr:hypothetical protein [Frankiales bacterium]
MTRLLTAALTAALVTGCSGQSCDELGALQAEREERRAAHTALIGTSASDGEIGEADDRLHAFERRVYDLEQSCERR